jgi:hypothetical protein
MSRVCAEAPTRIQPVRRQSNMGAFVPVDDDDIEWLSLADRLEEEEWERQFTATLNS